LALSSFFSKIGILKVDKFFIWLVNYWKESKLGIVWILFKFSEILLFYFVTEEYSYFLVLLIILKLFELIAIGLSVELVDLWEIYDWPLIGVGSVEFSILFNFLYSIICKDYLRDGSIIFCYS